jgi:hypothetical protein
MSGASTSVCGKSLPMSRIAKLLTDLVCRMATNTVLNYLNHPKNRKKVILYGDFSKKCGRRLTEGVV